MSYSFMALTEEYEQVKCEIIASFEYKNNKTVYYTKDNKNLYVDKL